MNTWKRVTEMLQAYREQQRSTWGDTDDVLIAKYLSGGCASEEKEVVEQAAARHPALAELLQVLRAIAAAPAPIVPSAVGMWNILGATTRLVEGLAVWLDEAGRVAAAGLRGVLALPELSFAGAMKPAGAATRAGEAVWSIPLPDAGGRLTLAVAPAESPGLWSLWIKVELPAAAKLNEGARLEIRNEQGEIELAGPLGNFLNKTVTLEEGSWQMRLLDVGPPELVLPLKLGPSLSGSSS